MNTITNNKFEVEHLIISTLQALSAAKYNGDIISLHVSKGSIPEVRVVIGNFETTKMIYTNAIFTNEVGLIFK